MDRHAIAVIPGDGVGVDVIDEGRRTLDLLGDVTGSFALDYTELPWGCAYYVAHGAMMPPDGMAILRDFPAIYLGAVGFPTVPDHVSLWGLLLPIRKEFAQYVNLRPIKLLPGVRGRLLDKGPDDIDFVCIRENTEGEYAGAGGRIHLGQPHEVALQSILFTRTGVERIIRYAFELAREQGRSSVASATKSNAMQFTMVFWDEVFAEVARDYPEIATAKYHVDALAARFITHPESLDVVVASNLFGDILTDLGGALQGSLGIPPSSNIDPTRRYPSMFEPVHGSAPDIAGKGIANPLAAIWAGQLMIDFLGHRDAARLLMLAIEDVTRTGTVLTPDLGGRATTRDVGEAVRSAIKRLGR